MSVKKGRVISSVLVVLMMVTLCLGMNMTSVEAAAPYPIQDLVLSPEVPAAWVDSCEAYTTTTYLTMSLPGSWNGTYTYTDANTPSLQAGTYGSPLTSSTAKMLVGGTADNYGKIFFNSTLPSTAQYVRISFYYYEEQASSSSLWLRYRSKNNRNLGYRDVEIRKFAYTGTANTGRWKKVTVELDDACFDNGLLTQTGATTYNGAPSDFYIGSTARFMIGGVDIIEASAESVSVPKYYDWSKLHERYISNNVVNNTSITGIFAKEITQGSGSYFRHLGFETVGGAFDPNIPANQKMKFVVCYLDTGTGDMEFTYMSTTGAKTVTKARTNTGTWLNWPIVINDANLNNTLTLTTNTSTITGISFGVTNKTSTLGALLIRGVQAEVIDGDYASDIYITQNNLYSNPVSLIANTNFTATASIYDNNDTESIPEDMVVVLALYDKNGVLQNVVSNTAAIEGSTWQNITTPNLAIPSVLDGHYIKAFLWKGASLGETSMVPIHTNLYLK